MLCNNYQKCQKLCNNCQKTLCYATIAKNVKVMQQLPKMNVMLQLWKCTWNTNTCTVKQVSVIKIMLWLSIFIFNKSMALYYFSQMTFTWVCKLREEGVVGRRNRVSCDVNPESCDDTLVKRTPDPNNWACCCTNISQNVRIYMTKLTHHLLSDIYHKIVDVT
jgi:hypothetical protein